MCDSINNVRFELHNVPVKSIRVIVDTRFGLDRTEVG